jgi:predicted HicB family RNase H-like nuclease
MAFSFAQTRVFEMASDSEDTASEFIGAWLPPELHDRVKAAAEDADRTVSSWLRQALRRRLDAVERIREHSRQPAQK